MVQSQLSMCVCLCVCVSACVSVYVHKECGLWSRKDKVLMLT